jgi:hypothetical protein
MTARKFILPLSLVALFCLFPGGVASAQAPGQSQPEDWTAPPAPTSLQVDDTKDEGISGGRIAGEILVGGLTGVGGGFLGALVGIAVEDCSDSEGSYCGLAGAVIGGYAGYTTGVALGVYGVGSGGDHEGSLGATMGGSFLGGVGAIVLNVGTDGDAALLLPLAPIAGALVGFHTTSRRRRGTREEAPLVGSLLNVKDGTASLGLPMISVVSTAQGTGQATMVQLAGGSL